MRRALPGFGVLAGLLAGCGAPLPPAPPPVSPPPVDELAPVPVDPVPPELPDARLPEPWTGEGDETPLDEILDSPWVDHPELADRIDWWTGFWSSRGSQYFGRSIQRMGLYHELVDRGIRTRDLPGSLRYLPVIESYYSPRAVSRVGAAGLWQFMSPTARFMGLRVTPLLDERRDPHLSTEVALNYLVDLRGRFGSWFLALAAYNGGPGRMERVLRRYGGEGPWDDGTFLRVRQHLPRETRDFIPKFLAAARVASDPVAYGLADVEPHPPLTFDQVSVPDATSLDVIARAAEASQDEVDELNPHLVRGYTPPGVSTWVRIPAGRTSTFIANYASIPPGERVSFIEHRVARGETLSHIARAYGVRLAELQAANPRVSPRRLQIGQDLIIPRGASARTGGSAGAAAGGGAQGPERGPVTPARASVEAAETPAGGSSRSADHRVEDGESLWTIARSYGVSVEELVEWNGLQEGAVIYPGDQLTVRIVRRAVHTVRSGDTLSGIAARYGVRVSDLARLNGIRLEAILRPGDEVLIPAR